MGGSYRVVAAVAVEDDGRCATFTFATRWYIGQRGDEAGFIFRGALAFGIPSFIARFSTVIEESPLTTDIKISWAYNADLSTLEGSVGSVRPL